MKNLQHKDVLKIIARTMVAFNYILLTILILVYAFTNGNSDTGMLAAIIMNFLSPILLLIAIELNGMRGGYKGTKDWILSQFWFFLFSLLPSIFISWLLSGIGLDGCPVGYDGLSLATGQCIYFDGTTILSFLTLYSISMLIGFVIALIVKSIRRMIPLMKKTVDNGRS